MHCDIPIQDIDESDSNSPKVLNKSQPTADTNHFFKKAPRIPGSNKGRVTCNCCQYVFFFRAWRTILIFIRNGTGGCLKKTTTIVDEVSMLRRHIQAHHPVCSIDINAHIVMTFDRVCTENGPNATTSNQCYQRIRRNTGNC